MKLISGYIKEAKDDFQFKAKHKNPEGGLSEAGRKAYNRETGGNLKRPQPEGGSRRDSFCARMKGMKAKLTSAETARDPDSRINKSLRKWKCSYDMSEVKEAAKRKGLWANIHAKRERGEAPAKPGDADFPDAKNWKKVTQESEKGAKENTNDVENAEKLKARLIAAIKYHDGKILGATPYFTTNIENGIYFRDKNKNLMVASPSYLPGHEIHSVDENVFEPEDINENLDEMIADYIESNKKEAAGRCWKGYEPVPGMKAKTKGSCRPVGTGKKESVKKADEEEMANKLMNIQQFMGQNPRRELSEEETKAVEKRKGSLLPSFFPNYADSPAVKMYSPLMPTLAMGALGGAGGSLLGKVIGKATGNEDAGTLVGGAGGAGLAALIAYLKRKQENANVEEIMRRLPRGATLRDYEADPLLQKNRDRKSQLAMAAMLARRL
jgi:hypothetical protein